MNRFQKPINIPILQPGGILQPKLLKHLPNKRPMTTRHDPKKQIRQLPFLPLSHQSLPLGSDMVFPKIKLLQAQPRGQLYRIILPNSRLNLLRILMSSGLADNLHIRIGQYLIPSRIQFYE